MFQREGLDNGICDNDFYYNYDTQYNIMNNNTINNISRISNNELEKKDNLNEESYNIADKLSRIQALISQVSGK